MNALTAIPVSIGVRVGAAGAVGAVTLLWTGAAHAAFFQAGTVLLVVSLVPLARGLGSRGGAMVGLLFGTVWIAARLGGVSALEPHLLLSEVNLIIVAAMMTIGGLAGALLADNEPDTQARGAIIASARGESMPSADEAGGRSQPREPAWREALHAHREWLAAMDSQNSPWTSFDNHVRGLVRVLTGMQRLRCYRVSETGRLHPLHKDPVQSGELPAQALLSHVATTGRAFLEGSSAAGPLLQALAEAGASRPVWVMPVRDGNRCIGVISAEGMGRANESQLQSVADFIEPIWLHVHHQDQLRTARQTDRGSGLINRTDFLASFKEVLDQCYHLHEPVVVVVVCLEGLRGLDDASQWARRDELVEAVGQTMAASLRKDDLIGRFSDSQFVALLRRLDVPLGELICRKMLSSIAKVIGQAELGTWVTPRAGLSGSGFAKPPAETLLQHAISALQKARTQDVLLAAELPENPKGARPA